MLTYDQAYFRNKTLKLYPEMSLIIVMTDLTMYIDENKIFITSIA